MSRITALLAFAAVLLAAAPLHAQSDVRDMDPAGLVAASAGSTGDTVPSSGPDASVSMPGNERANLLKTPKKTGGDDAFLCLDAPKGMTVPVPKPFNRWAVRVCTRQGQALVPAEGMAWVVHGAAGPVSILALPPGRKAKPATADFDPRYADRFTQLVGGKVEGDRRENAVAMLKQASGGKSDPSADEIWQLDARSNIGKTRYNLFFYLRHGAPAHMIACLDECRQALYLDVLSGEAAKAAIASVSLRR